MGNVVLTIAIVTNLLVLVIGVRMFLRYLRAHEKLTARDEAEDDPRFRPRRRRSSRHRHAEPPEEAQRSLD